MSILAVAALAAVLLAFANGANDNAKGVATLIGSRTMPRNQALRFAAVATILGSFSAILIGQGLAAKFSGKGLVDAHLLQSPAFVGCVGLAAAATVLLATRIGMPISTTHALVGGLAGVGLSADALHGSSLLHSFLVPLLIAPLLAVALAAPLYMLLRRVRHRLGVTRHTCVCIEREFHPVTVRSDGSMALATTGVRLGNEHTTAGCVERYCGQVAGVNAQQLLNWSHVFTAGATSFARGLNDTPKIAALIIAAGAAAPKHAMVAVGIAMAVGGLLAVRRVAETMSDRITAMNDGQAFTANFVTAVLVIFASKHGVPVSTTHVSCGSLFGIGLVNRRGNLGVISQIVLAWVTTLPVAGLIGWAAWRMLGD